MIFSISRFRDYFIRKRVIIKIFLLKIKFLKIVLSLTIYIIRESAETLIGTSKIIDKEEAK